MQIFSKAKKLKSQIKWLNRKPFTQATTAIPQISPISPNTLTNPSIKRLEVKKSFFQSSKLFQEWKATLFKRKYITKDIISGVNVASIVLPLSLAIAVASGVPPQVALISSVVGGILCSLFGGSTLSVSGPAAALSIVIYNIVALHGLNGLFVTCCIAGSLQIITGFLKWGKFVRLIPSPIIHGFIAGIGAIIFVKQIPRALGIQLSSEGGLLPQVYLLDCLTLSVMYVLRKYQPIKSIKSLAPLAGVASCGLVNYFGNFGAPVIGSIPNSMPLPHLFDFIITQELIGYGILIFALCSLETLLSCSAVDQLTFKREKSSPIKESWLKNRYDPNQELIGQGLANFTVPFFSGMPVTSVVVRSSVNVESGAMTKRAGVFHSLTILICVLAFAPIISYLPYASLAAVLLSVSLGMMDPKAPTHIWKVNKIELIPFMAVSIGLCFVGMIESVGIGLAIYLFSMIAKKGRNCFETAKWNVNLVSENVLEVKIMGPITFISIPTLSLLKEEIRKNLKMDMVVKFNLEMITEMDITGMEKLVGIFELANDFYCKMIVKGDENIKQKIGHCKPNDVQIIYE